MSDHGVTDLMSGALGPVLPKAPTGIRGLDEITRGGLASSSYLGMLVAQSM